jgi:hypothetical protein
MDYSTDAFRDGFIDRRQLAFLNINDTSVKTVNALEKKLETHLSIAKNHFQRVGKAPEERRRRDQPISRSTLLEPQEFAPRNLLLNCNGVGGLTKGVAIVECHYIFALVVR